MSEFKKAPRQLSFGFVSEKDASDQVSFNHVPVQKSTFKAGMEQPLHRWFRLTPSFGPELVQQMLVGLDYREGDIVLDPFAGAGTTLIECSLNAIESFGFEINPFLHFVSDTCLNWEVAPDRVEELLQEAHKNFNNRVAVHTEADFESGELPIPKIHNPYRWWRKDVLKELVILRDVLRDLECSGPEKNLLLLGLAAVLVPDLTNVTLGRLQLHFIDRSEEIFQVWDTYAKQIGLVVEDLNYLQTITMRKGHVFLTDATSPRVNEYKKARLVITSPPYPNRYSYVWNTRPHLFFFELFDRPRQAADLDKKTIGGTWGSATSVLAKGKVLPEFPVLEKVISPISDEIRKAENGNLMANYLMKYFNLLANQIVAMEPYVTSDARLAYVVGCSWLKGVYVETDVLLGQVMEGLGLGYAGVDIDRFRRRHSGIDLFESIVYAQKR